MITLYITFTSRSPHHSSQWRAFHETVEHFPDMAAAKAWLKDTYCHVKKRQPIYVDTKSRGTIQSGWVYCYKGEVDISHGDMRIMYYQDWVHVCEEHSTTVDVKRSA